MQLDELWAEVKQSTQEVWVWVACDAKTKVVPVLQLGPHSQTMAYAVAHELKSRLQAGCVPVFTSDGLKHYFYALTAHFGERIRPAGQTKPVWLLFTDFCYAQVIKLQRRFRLMKMEPRLLWGDPTEFATRLKSYGLTSRINTSFVERLNLTLRRNVAKLAPRTWATAQHTSKLTAHLQWWLAYYHFIHEHASLRCKLKKPIPQRGNAHRGNIKRSRP